MKSLVSVVIPTYKRAHILSRAIDSVLNQTYKNIEIIIIDDNDKNTTERTETQKIMNKYINYNNIKYIQHSSNKGGSFARNTGWQNAHGKYITFLDDDDEISELKIQKQVECLEKLDESWGACYTAYSIIMPNGKIQKSATNNIGNVYIQSLMRTLYMGSGSNLLLRKSCVDEINGYDISFKRNQDIEFMVRIFERYKLAFIDLNLLTIHQEGTRTQRSYEYIDQISQFYLEKFSESINKLNNYDKKRVLDVISLERSRTALSYKKYKDVFKILQDNKVSLLRRIKYCSYLVKRYILKKSYGFYIE